MEVPARPQIPQLTTAELKTPTDTVDDQVTAPIAQTAFTDEEINLLACARSSSNLSLKPSRISWLYSLCLLSDKDTVISQALYLTNISIMVPLLHSSAKIQNS